MLRSHLQTKSYRFHAFILVENCTFHCSYRFIPINILAFIKILFTDINLNNKSDKVNSFFSVLYFIQRISNQHHLLKSSLTHVWIIKTETKVSLNVCLIETNFRRNLLLTTFT